MQVFRRGFFGMIKGLIITAATGGLVYAGCYLFLEGTVAIAIPAAVTLLLLYITVFSENIRIEVEAGVLRHYVGRRLKGEYNLPQCATRYSIRSDMSFPPTHDIDLYLVDLENGFGNEVSIDLSPLGYRQFQRLYALIEQTAPSTVQKLQTTKK